MHKIKVTTRNGTQHIIDLDDRTWVRHPSPGREFTNPFLTPDGEPFHFWNIEGIELGGNLYASNKDEWRQSSIIIQIEEID
jgi:hypothetical protein